MSRSAQVNRKTLETQITVQLELDGQGSTELNTGLPFFEHMMAQIARHGLFDIEVHAQGDLDVDAHHTVEDIGITLGQAFAEATQNKSSLTRYGHAYVPLDEALSRVVVDISGRPGLSYEVSFVRSRIADFDVDLLREFFQGFVNHALVTLHVDNIKGNNAHHQAESIFKAFGRALRMATTLDPRVSGTPSTKGLL